MSGLKSISPSSQFGQSRVTLEFSDTVDLAVAAKRRARRDRTDHRSAAWMTRDAPQIVKADSICSRSCVS